MEINPNQLELFDKEDWQILLEADEYFKYLQKPNKAFSDMPVCPFLKSEIEKDNLYVDIWKPDKRSFYELFYEPNYVEENNLSTMNDEERTLKTSIVGIVLYLL